VKEFLELLVAVNLQDLKPFAHMMVKMFKSVQMVVLQIAKHLVIKIFASQKMENQPLELFSLHVLNITL
jgi:hypothetical protein